MEFAPNPQPEVRILLGLAQAEEEELRILRAAEECAPPVPAEEQGAPCFSGDITLTVRGQAVTLSPEQARNFDTARKLGCCVAGAQQVM